MKKITILAFALLVVGLAAPAAFAQSNWNLANGAGYDVFYQVTSKAGVDEGIWMHHMDIVKMDMKTGAFSGTGYFAANNAYHWGIVTGTVTGDGMKYKIEYDGYSAGYAVDHTGKITKDATFTGDCTTTMSQTCKYWTKNTVKSADTDGDGVKDPDDACANTPKGDKVNKVGCSMTQLCPCAYWSNHGEYVSCIAKAKKVFVDEGILTNKEAGDIQSAAAQSDCGKK